MIEEVRLPRLLQKVLDSSGNTLKEKARLHPSALSVELNLYPLSRATMTLAEDDPEVKIHDFVEIFGQNGSLGIFRVASIATTYRKQRQLQLNHCLDLFSDAVLVGETTFNGHVRAFLEQVFAGQRANIGGTPYWQLGVCEDENPYTFDIKYTNAMQCLTDIGRREEDYYFTFDFSRFPWTANFIRRDDTVLSEFRLARNMESCQVSLNNADLCTRLYLSIDTTTQTANGETTTTTHETHNDTSAQSTWGIVEKTAGIKAEEVPSKSEWVSQYFARHSQPTVQINISGLELNRLTNESIDEMHIGRVCRVALPDYSTTFNERIVALTYPDILRNPMKVTVSLANKRQTAEGSFAGLSSQTSSLSSQTSSNSKDIKNNKASGTAEVKAATSVLRSEIWSSDSMMYSLIQQTASSIRSEIVAVESGFGSAITQTASSIRAELWSSDSQMYSAITQTSSMLHSEIVNVSSDMGSSITQTASEIRSEVHASDSQMYSVITQTSDEIRSEVHAVDSSLSSSISQTNSQISMKVSKGDISSTINQTAQSVLIQANKIDLDGYVTMSTFNAAISGYATSFTTVNLYPTNTYCGNTYTTTLYVNSQSASWQSQYVVTGVNTTRVTIRDHDNDPVSFTALSPNSPYNGKTIYYIGGT